MSKSSKSIDKRILRELQNNDLSIVSYRSRKHIVLKVAHQNGNTGTLVFATSPSDQRGLRNNLAQIRKTANSLTA